MPDTPPKHRPAKILVVDDERSTARLLEFVLVKQGYQVRTAADGELALAAIADFGPDVVLLDYQLPKLSGLEVLQRVRADDRQPRLLVVLLSASAAEELPAERSLADAHRTKPIAPPELVRTLVELGVPAFLADDGPPTP